MPAYCSLCGGVLPGYAYDDQECPHCAEMFLEDVKAGRIPAGLIPQKSFKFADWREFRLYERRVAEEGINLEEARREIARRVEEKRRRYEEQIAREEAVKRQMAAASKEAIRGRYLY